MSSFQMYEKSWEKKHFFEFFAHYWSQCKVFIQRVWLQIHFYSYKDKNLKLFISIKIKNFKLNFFPIFLYFVGFFQNTCGFTSDRSRNSGYGPNMLADFIEFV